MVSSPLITFIFWAILGCGISLAAIALRARDSLSGQVRTLRTGRREYLMLFLTTGTMQFCTLMTFQVLQVGYALALFQTSAIISVLLGYRIFREPHFIQRLTGSIVMAIGAAMIISSR